MMKSSNPDNARASANCGSSASRSAAWARCSMSANIQDRQTASCCCHPTWVTRRSTRRFARPAASPAGIPARCRQWRQARSSTSCGAPQKAGSRHPRAQRRCGLPMAAMRASASRSNCSAPPCPPTMSSCCRAGTTGACGRPPCRKCSSAFAGPDRKRYNIGKFSPCSRAQALAIPYPASA